MKSIHFGEIYYIVYDSLAIVTLVIIVVAIALAFKKNIKSTLIAFSLVVITMPSCVAYSVWFENRLELNHRPDINNIYGVWEYDGSLLTLNKEGTFQIEGKGELDDKTYNRVRSGTWNLNDWNLRLYVNGKEQGVKLRTIAFENQTRIIWEVEDFDAWNQRLGYKKRN